MRRARRSVVTLAPAHAGPAAAFMLIGAAVTFHTILEVADAFPDVFASDLLRCVLVATVAGVARVVIADVAGATFGIVVIV